MYGIFVNSWKLIWVKSCFVKSMYIDWLQGPHLL
ncbi:hypothetical protein HMPREF1002_04381 [Porphyromonas sp. 31_2]|nr:hypothetical protein HMPREF1002_04381 [Porphyromonas sp. 31_2]